MSRINNSRVWSLGLLTGHCLLFATACNLQVAGQGSSTDSAAGGTTGASAPAGTTPEAAATADVSARDIEEADIVKIAGGKLYALNRFKGLLIVDVSDPDAPVLLGTLDLRGRGVEMYVVGQRVYAVLSADYAYALNDTAIPPEAGGGSSGSGGGSTGSPIVPTVAPGPPVPPPDFEGSQLAIIDVSNPASPTALSKINLAGYASDSRRVGNIIYVVGATIFPYYFASQDSTRQDEGFVASIDVTDPDNVIPVERKTFKGSSLAVHVSDALILAASQVYDSGDAGTSTHIQVIDISDASGAIDLRGTVDVPGAIRNRFYMDDLDDVLRIATESNGFGFQDIKLYTYDLSDLDNIAPLGSVLIKRGESLQAVRFDGQRGYAVTFMRTDPLFVLDLSNPSAPLVAGEVEVPGFSTHMEPRGNRLIAVGIDDTNGSRPAVAYYDVQDPTNPTELGRVVLGPPGSYTDSNATYDEKAFKIVDEMGLIAIPFSHVDYSGSSGGGGGVPIPVQAGGYTGQEANASGASDITAPATGASPVYASCLNAVQLVDFSDTALTQRGWFPHTGRVERVGALGTRIFGISQAALQTVDITDRDNPVKAGEVKFFTDAEAPLYNDCGFVFYENPPTGVTPIDLNALLAQFCGRTSVTPLMITAMLLGFARFGRRSVRRRYANEK